MRNRSGLLWAPLIVCVLILSLKTRAQVQPLGSVIGNQTVISIPIQPPGYAMAQALIYYPDDYFKPENAAKRYPLFIFMHGAGEGTSDNITQVTNTSLPQLIKNGLKPYGIDSLTGDTVKFIVISPHAAKTGGSYSYPQLRYTIPYLFTAYRVDTTRVWLGGLSMGGRATFSVPMEDPTLGNRLAGIMPMSNGGYDQRFDLIPNLGKCLKNGLSAIYTVGSNDGGALNYARVYRDSMAKNAQPGKFFYREVPGADHNSAAWNPPFYLESRWWNNNKRNAWDLMANTRRGKETTTSLSASAGNNRSLTLPQNSTELSGTYLSALGILSVGWTRVSGPNAPSFSNPSSAKTTVSNLVKGTYVFRFSVTNILGSVALSEVTVAVNDAVNNAPVANAGAAQTITLPLNSVSLSGTGTDTDGTIASYSWSKVSGGNAVITSPNTAATTVTGLEAGTYSFRLTVTDNSGATGAASVNVTVNAATNTAPVANAGTAQTITLPLNSVSLSGTGTDTDGTIASYSWSKVSGGNAVITSPNTAATTVTGLEAGTYSFRLTVTDNSGATGAASVNVTVNAATNTAPVANAGTAQTITLPLNSVTLSGTGIDTDGTIASYSWAKVSGGNAIITSPNTATTTVTGLEEGTYSFRLTVTDNKGATANSTVNITVNAAAAKPSSGRIVMKTVGCTEYRVAYLFSDSSVRSLYYNAASGKVELLPYNLQGKKAIDLAMGFNVSAILDNEGYPWVSRTNQITVDRITTDTTGAPFNGNVAIFGYFFTYFTIKQDGSVWMWGGDDYRLIPGTTPITKPVRISPVGMKFKKIAPGGTIVGLTTTGEVYEWFKDGSLTPTKRVIPRPAIDIFASHYAYRGCVIPDAGGDPTMGYPYVWGSDFGFWGGDKAYAEPTSVKELWKMTEPVKEIIANQNTIHYIDRLDRLWGIGDNACGEIGNGQQLVNHADIYKTPYNWSWIKGEALTGAPPQHIAPGTRFKKLFTSNTFNFYMYAIDINDSCYFWGRDKSFLGGTGVANAQAATYPNALDVLAPKMVTPLAITPTTAAYYTFTPYTINGGADQNISVYKTTLSGSATPSRLTANGKTPIVYEIASYKWTKISGGSCTIVTPDAATTEITGLQNGTYKFQFKMTDTHTGTIADTVTVVVGSTLPPNASPVADAGADKTITLPTNTVSLSGSGKDTDGTIAVYLWSKVSGPATFTISTPAQAGTSVNGLVEGVYVFELRVTDDKGAVGKDSVTVTVLGAPNKAPVAKAGSDISITLPVNTAALNGSASSDEDGTISSYVWTKVSGPAGGGITNASTANATANNLIEGTYVFELVVTDNKGAKGKDSVAVTVLAAPNKAPVANAGKDIVLTLPVNTTALNGAASSDEDGTIATYVWVKKSGPATGSILNATSVQATANNLVEGVYVFELTVTDNKGAVSKDEVQVTVNPAPNKAPVANAGDDIIITLPLNSVALNGSASNDEDGTISTYSWAKTGGPASGSLTSTTGVNTTATGLVQGLYTFELTVTDNKGAISKDQVLVTVNSALNKAPVANAGNDIVITLPVNMAVLNGGASADEDGTIAKYEWKKVTGPATGTIASPATALTDVTALTEGTYEFELTVTDDKGALGKATVKVVVNPAPNKAPVANAGNDVTITLPVNSVTLNGSGSVDTDGTIASYKWQQTSGPAQSTIASVSGVSTLVSGLVAGTYVFELTVTDNKGATAKATVKVVVNPAPNKAPVANAGNDVTITLPVNSVTLNGSGSVDTDGTIASYKWQQTSGPAQSTIASVSGVSTLVSGLVAGTYVFELTVTDNKGATAKATVKVVVNPAPNKAPVANAGNDVTITLPVNSVTLNGSGSVDTDGTIASYKWQQTSGPAQSTIASVSGVSTLVSGLVAGTYVFELTVTDNKGATAKATVKVVVNPAPNKAPVANAGNDVTITLPVNSVTLNGSGSVDTDGTIASYKWQQTSGPAQSTIASVSGVSTLVSGLVAGTYVFELTVTDNKGTTAKATVKVVVNPAPNKAPVANAGNDVTITLPVNSVTLNGSGSDTDGKIVSYSWSKVSGPSTGTIVAPSLASSPVNGLAEGVYVFKLTVTDDKGATGSANVKVTVLPKPNVGPVANAGQDVVVTLPVNTAALDGSASYDPDGRIVTYSWVKIEGPSPFTIYSSNTAKPSLVNLLEGEYLFELTVTDDRGATAKDQVKLSVQKQAVANKAPVANAGSDITIVLPETTATLNGSSSTDTDGTIKSYNWAMISGPSAATIAFPGAHTTVVSGLVAGTYEFELTVVDDKGATAKVRVKVIVKHSAQRYEEFAQVYPNPTVGSDLQYRYQSDENERLVVTVISLKGEKLMTKTIEKTTSVLTDRINTSAWAPGMYFLQIRNDKKIKYLIRFVKG